jgi:hypothetical protein
MAVDNAQVREDAFSRALVSANVAATAAPTSNASATLARARAFPRFVQAYEESERKWQIDIQNQLVEHVQMAEGWDGYGAPAPSMDTAFFALLVLNKIMRTRSPIPQVVPSSTGGIQLEWHEKDIDLELHIFAPYQCEMWFQDHRQAEQPPTSLELAADFGPLNEPMKLLTSR